MGRKRAEDQSSRLGGLAEDLAVVLRAGLARRFSTLLCVADGRSAVEGRCGCGDREEAVGTRVRAGMMCFAAASSYA